MGKTGMGHTRVAIALLSAVFLGLIAMLVFTALPASAQDAVLRGTLRSSGEPVAGVVLVATDADGTEIGSATTGDDGKWEIPISAIGSYTVTLDVETLPEGVTFKEDATNEVTVELDELRNKAVGFKLEDGEAAPLVEIRPTWQRLLDRAATGMKVGLLMALAAVGLSLIYGVTGLVNFAHSEMVTFGAVAAFGLEALFGGLPFWLIVIMAVIVGGFLGFVLEGALFRPLRKRKLSLISLMVVSIGLAFVIRYLIVIYFGAEPDAYNAYQIQIARDYGPFLLPPKDLFIMGIAFVMLILVGVLLQKTKLGTAMRAVADNPPLAQSSGINVDSTIMAVWIAGSALAALGGVFLGLTQVVEWQMGEKTLLLIFAAVTLGGLGTAYGAMVGGLVIGFASEFSTYWLDNDLKFMIALIALILVLLFRPQGILGVRERFG